MNDSGSFCRCPDCLARISGEKNYLGWVDYSDLYYDWCNRVIEGVLKRAPGQMVRLPGVLQRGDAAARRT